jgi:hypothetical protein
MSARCYVLELARTTYLFGSRQKQLTVLDVRLPEIAQSRVHRGYHVARVLLDRER